MSLILEALRKSEAERRRGAAPDLHTELPTSPALARSTVPGWVLWMLAAAAAVLMLIWAVHAWWPRTPVPAQATAAPRIAPVKPVAPVLRPVARLSPAAAASPSPSPSPSAATAPAPAPAQPVAKAATATPPEAIAPLPAQAPASTTLHAAAPAPPADDALLLSDLSVDERKALPPLKLSMHLWNDDPSRRFVILDGNRLREGDRVGNAVITAITTDGVVLDWNGRRIKLSIR